MCESLLSGIQILAKKLFAGFKWSNFVYDPTCRGFMNSTLSFYIFC